MNKLFTYLLALCTATCLYGCSEELEEMTSTEESFKHCQPFNP